jgi:transcriptional regulator with XRE-family HTH domain
MAKRTVKSKSLGKGGIDQLRALRIKLGWTQREMAKEFGVSPGAIALWEQGDRPIPGPVLKLLLFYEQGLQKKLS